jgi:hypothetical protein
MKLDRYKENLRIEDDKVISYVTHVATIVDDKYLVVHGYWSKTTSKHINYVAKVKNLIVTSDLGIKS